MPKTTRVDKLLMGDEPLSVSGDSNSKLARIFSWYNEYYGRDKFEKSIKFTIEHLKRIKYDPEVIMKLENIPGTEVFYFPPTIGWIFRQLDVQGYIPEDMVKKQFVKLSDFLKTKQSVFSGSQNLEDSIESPKMIDKPIKNTSMIENIIGSIDDLLDRAYDVDFKLKVDFTDFLKKKNISEKSSVVVSNYVGPIAKELWLALHNKDPQLVEGYAHFGKPKLVAYYQFLENLLKETLKFANDTRIAKAANRKPRKKKVKTATQLTQKVKFQASNDKYQLKGEHPSAIVGASQVWTFNSKTRFLGVYHSEKQDVPLTIKGSTIIGYDKKQSIQKKVRKPDKVLSEVLSGGKVALRKILMNINAKEKFLNGRINKDTLILRTLK